MADHRGFLTETDELFLKGGKKYGSKQQRYDRRKAIRERTREALRDFSLLYEELDRVERNKIFEPEDRPARLLLEDGITDTIGFLYIALEGEVDSDDFQDREFSPRFRDMLDVAVSKAEADRRPQPNDEIVTTVDFETSVTHPGQVDLDRVIDKLARRSGHELNAVEAKVVADILATDDESRHLGMSEFVDRIQERRQKITLGSESDGE